jgi:hypothetical protein
MPALVFELPVVRPWQPNSAILKRELSNLILFSRTNGREKTAVNGQEPVFIPMR